MREKNKRLEITKPNHRKSGIFPVKNTMQAFQKKAKMTVLRDFGRKGD